MLAITVDLLAGTIRAASHEDLSLAGRGGDPDPGDWPPSPARLFAALVAAGGTRDSCIVGDGSELRELESAPPPRILASADSEVLKSPQVARYVVVNERSNGAVQEYQGRTSTMVRPSIRLSPAIPTVVYIWDSLRLEPAQLASLRFRSARVGYLGCADSPVRIRVSESEPASSSLPQWAPSEQGTKLIPVPFPGMLQVLDDAFDDFTSGMPVRRSWFRSVQCLYETPGLASAPTHQAPIAIWLRFDAAVSGRRALLVSETLKAALLDLYDRYVTGGAGVPPVLHGHGLEVIQGYDHVCIASLPDCGHSYARGRLYGAAIILPRNCTTEVVEGVRSALFRLRTLVLPGGARIGVRLDAGEGRPQAANPQRWIGPSRYWISANPVVLERRQRHGLDLEEVTRWCLHAGLPDPASFRVSPVPLLEGALALTPSEVFHSRTSRRPYFHVALKFNQAVSGPIVLGRMRHLGIGLLAPVREKDWHEQLP